MQIGAIIDDILKTYGIEESDFCRYYWRNNANADSVTEHIRSFDDKITKEQVDAEMKERARRSIDRLVAK